MVGWSLCGLWRGSRRVGVVVCDCTCMMVWYDESWTPLRHCLCIVAGSNGLPFLIFIDFNDEMVMTR